MFSSSIARRWAGAILSAAVVIGGAIVAAPLATAAPTAQTCNYAPAGQGVNSRTLCWLDMTDYDGVAAAAGGQQMQLNLPGGYTMTYTLTQSGRRVTPSAIPTIPTAFIGNSGGYGGVAGKPSLYQVNRAVDPSTSTTLRMDNISMVDVNGNPVTAFAIVGVDAEQTTTSESIIWTSDKPMTQMIPIKNACDGAFTGVGTTSVTCSATNSFNRTGSAMLVAQNPTFMSQRMVNAPTGVQGVAFAVLLSKVRLDKVVNGRIDASDDFNLSVATSDNSVLKTASTGIATTGTTGEVETIGSTTSSPFTLAETSSPTVLADYNSTWACTRNGVADPALPSGAAGASATVTLAVGDLVACTLTNTARSVSLTLQKSAGTPTDVNGNGIIDAGDTIGYSFLVTNAGELPLVNVAVNDPVLGAVNCPAGTLAPGASITCSGASDYTITAADAVRGAVVNDAVATANPEGSPATATSNTSSTSTPVATAAPALNLVKTADPTTVSAAGDSVTYSFAVTNTGNVPISDLSVSETQFTGSGTAPVVTCPVTTLAVGNSTSCSATYTFTQVDIDSGSVVNTAVASGTSEGRAVSSDPSSATVSATPSPSLGLIKSVSPNSAASFTLGQTLAYSFVVTNTGNVTVSGVAIAERSFSGSNPLSAIVCGPGAASLAPGGQVTCSATYTITQTDINAGSLDNVAAATGTSPSGADVVSPDANATVPADQEPSLSLTKSADPSSATAAGQVINYTFDITNTGNVTLSGASVTETQFSGTGTAPVVSCPPEAATLLPGARVTCSATYALTAADADAGSVSNTATASATDPGGATIPTTPSTAVVEIAPVESLTLLKTASPGQLSAAGDVVTYSFVVTNTGNVTLSNVSVQDTDFTGTGAAPTITCPADAASLGAGLSVTCSASYTATQADVDSGAISNTATAGGTGPGGAVTSDPSTAVVPINAVPNLTIIKTASTPTVSAAGDTIEYSFVVTNTGNVTLANITIREGVFTGRAAVPGPSCPPEAASLAPGDSVTCSMTVSVTQEDIDDGRVSNTATAAGTPPGSAEPVVSPPSTVIVTAITQPALTLVKSVAPITVGAVGDIVTYSFLITNTGNVTLHDLGVSEGSFSGTGTPIAVVCPPSAASLAPAATLTCTATYAVTQQDIDAGEVTNSATAQGTAPGADAATVSEPASASLTAVAEPALSLTKTADQSDLVAGQSVKYSFVVNNIGNVTLTDISISELSFSGHGPVPTVQCPTTTMMLAPAASVTCSAEYVVTQSDVDAGRVANIATASGVTTDPSERPATSEPSAAIIPSDLVPTLSMTKIADPATIGAFTAGATINYKFVITNTGSVTVDDIVVQETVFSGAGAQPVPVCPSEAAELAPGATVTCTATYTLVAADQGSASVSNTAVADGVEDGTTVHIVSDPSTAVVQAPATLPGTGSTASGALIAGLVTLLAGLGILVHRKRKGIAR